MDISPKEYAQLVKQKSKKSPIVKNTVLAFVIGGAICVIGQLIMNGWGAAGLDKEDAGTATSCSLVFLSALFTGLNLYNKLAKYGGALPERGRWCRSRDLPTPWFPPPLIFAARALSPAWRQKCFWWRGL